MPSPAVSTAAGPAGVVVTPRAAAAEEPRTSASVDRTSLTACWWRAGVAAVETPPASVAAAAQRRAALALVAMERAGQMPGAAPRIREDQAANTIPDLRRPARLAHSAPAALGLTILARTTAAAAVAAATTVAGVVVRTAAVAGAVVTVRPAPFSLVGSNKAMGG